MNTTNNKKTKFIRPLKRPSVVLVSDAGTPCRPSGEL